MPGSTGRGEGMIVLFICLGIGALLIAALLRNESIYSSRVQFLFKTDAERRLYEALPSYDVMLFHPKHWGRWTKAQWVAYANRVTKK